MNVSGIRTVLSVLVYGTKERRSFGARENYKYFKTVWKLVNRQLKGRSVDDEVQIVTIYGKYSIKSMLENNPSKKNHHQLPTQILIFPSFP